MLKSTFGCLVVFAIVGFALFIGCNKLVDGVCGNEILRTATSPDGKVKAVVFQRDCGATTGYSEQVSLLASSANLPNEGGTTFDADAGTAPKGPQVQVRWKDNTTLVIRHHPKARIFHAEKRVKVAVGLLADKNITVLYEK